MRECRSYSSSKAPTSLRRSRCISVASGDTSSLPFGENTARNTITLLRLLLNYTSNLCKRMYCGLHETRLRLRLPCPGEASFRVNHSTSAYINLTYSSAGDEEA